jgi:predicted RNA-binding Zn-ribbon protein involved in translation (DUF1610 family)
MVETKFRCLECSALITHLYFNGTSVDDRLADIVFVVRVVDGKLRVSEFPENENNFFDEKKVVVAVQRYLDDTPVYDDTDFTCPECGEYISVPSHLNQANEYLDEVASCLGCYDPERDALRSGRVVFTYHGEDGKWTWEEEEKHV